jgi:hypothetical protein
MSKLIHKKAVTEIDMSSKPALETEKYRINKQSTGRNTHLIRCISRLTFTKIVGRLEISKLELHREEKRLSRQNKELHVWLQAMKEMRRI